MNALKSKAKKVSFDADKVTSALLDYFLQNLEQMTETGNVQGLTGLGEKIARKYLKDKHPKIPFAVKVKVSLENFGGRKGNSTDKIGAFLAFHEFLGQIREKEEIVAKSTRVLLKAPLPLEAFDYMGHNKLDVSSSKDGYALLFDKR